MIVIVAGRRQLQLKFNEIFWVPCVDNMHKVLTSSFDRQWKIHTHCGWSWTEDLHGRPAPHSLICGSLGTPLI